MRLFLVVAAALVATALARPVSDVARDAFEESVLTPQEPPTKKPGQLVEPLYNGPGQLRFGAPLAWDNQRITPQEPPTKKPGQLVEPLYNGPGRLQFGAPLAWDKQRITPQEPPTKKPGQLVEPLYNGPGRFQFGALLHFGAPLAWDTQRITPQVPGADESNPPSLSKKQPPTIFEGVPLESDYDTRDLQPMDTTAG